MAACPHELVGHFDHVHRNTDRSTLVRDGSRNSLADPPRRIGRELVAASILELLDRLHQADIAFLDQVQELKIAVGVLLRDGNHEAQIGLDHLNLGLLRLALAALDLAHGLTQELFGHGGLFFHLFDLLFGAFHDLAQLGDLIRGQAKRLG